MYSVVIVDDELWSLIGMRNSFHWEQYGFRIALEAGVPQRALAYICTNNPDVVFTDIRMNDMNGLELMQLAREAGVTSEFIFISGYDDFAYVQKAVQLGAFRYLLKPLDREETDGLLRDLRQKLIKTEEKMPPANMKNRSSTIPSCALKSCF